MPEWLKGTGCKPVGYAYVGSNPTPSTRPPGQEDKEKDAAGRPEGARGRAGAIGMPETGGSTNAERV